MRLTLEFGASSTFYLSPFSIYYLDLGTDVGYWYVSNVRASRIGHGGGLELLCDSVKVHNVNVDPADGEDKLTMKKLLSWVRTNLIKERPEMFMKGDTVRPGVLVLVNDCDWELSGQLDTILEEKDVVVFISTLHGG